MRPGETDLPGIGKKTSIAMEGGDHLEVVIHTSGTRDVAFFRAGAAEPYHTVRLDPSAAYALGALLCAALESEAPEEYGVGRAERDVRS